MSSRAKRIRARRPRMPWANRAIVLKQRRASVKAAVTSIRRAQRLRGFAPAGGGLRAALYAPRTGPEKKNFDVGGINFATTAGGAVGTPVSAATGAFCVGLTQGVADNQRIGRKIRVKSILIKGWVLWNPTLLTEEQELCELFLVMDNAANGGTVTGNPAGVADVFSSFGVGQTLMNLDNSKRFKILRKFQYGFNTKFMVATGGASTLGVEQIRPIEWYVKCNTPMVYSAATGAQSEIRDNQFFLMGASQQGKCTFSLTSRIRFTDE